MCVPRAHLSAVAAEGGSTTAATGGGGGTGNMAALVARITEQLTTGYEEMKRVYGADMTEVVCRRARCLLHWRGSWG
ncbi:hypothetical protein EON68_03555 [archaeon]|nr:MAG: hypothetical protein EON68_03555 [archaeon]